MGPHGSLLLLTLLFTAVLHTAGSSRRDLAAAAVAPAVVGGRNAQRNRFPYYTSLREAVSNYHFCGSTLIGPRFLLTAAHCVTEWATPQAVEWSATHRAFPKARIGAFETYPVPAVPGATSFEQRQVIAVAVHRSYDAALQNDIALLLLDRPATRVPITLPTAPAQLQQRAPVGSKMLSIGFGMSQFQDVIDDMTAQAYEPTLQQLWMLRQPDTEGTFVMAGNPPRFLSDTWKGDSGGPLLVPNTTDPSRDMQFGIVSNGMYGQPGYYTDVSRYAAWITRGQQLLLEANGLGAEYHIKRVPACANTTNNYCAYCSAQGERLTCVDKTACHITYQGQTQLLLRCSDPEFQAGPRAASGCLRAIQYVDRTGYGQGPGILGNRTFTLQAALATRPPNDTHPSCPAPAPFVLKACPGAAPAPVCVPGARSLTGLESGCCACRRTRATVPYTLVYPAAQVANTYYKTVPNCKVAVRALLGGTLVHYTGALVTGNPWLGCQQKKYAKVVLEMLSTSGTGVSHGAFYVEADKLAHCTAGKTCTELGGNCQDAPSGCCTLAADGGAPTAHCAYPPDVVAPSACAAR